MSDVVVIGAGPNGLVAANVLADHGMQVVVFEAQDEPGGARPETGIRGLYLGSASAHPGGGVHGAPGAIAARALLAKRR
jgi:phytoene dehydrogenase-like protein